MFPTLQVSPLGLVPKKDLAYLVSTVAPSFLALGTFRQGSPLTVRVEGPEFLQQILALSFQIHDVIIREDQEAPPEQRLIGVNEGG